MNDALPPPIGPSNIELPDPRGPITEDFKRGACYLARIVMKENGVSEEIAMVEISIPHGHFKCPPEGKP